MLDYIFVSDNIKIVNVIKLKTKKQLEGLDYWPDKEEPSDHCMIWSEIEL